MEKRIENLEAALQEEGLSVLAELVKVIDDQRAAQLKFLGSPSFHVDGHDLWHEERENYLLSCRIYPALNGIKGFPTVVMLREQLKQFKGA